MWFLDEKKYDVFRIMENPNVLIEFLAGLLHGTTKFMINIKFNILAASLANKFCAILFIRKKKKEGHSCNMKIKV